VCGTIPSLSLTGKIPDTHDVNRNSKKIGRKFKLDDTRHNLFS